jgi:hypothetical protein
MKSLALLTLSMFLFACTSPDRKVSSENQLSEQERAEQLEEFGTGFRR